MSSVIPASVFCDLVLRRKWGDVEGVSIVGEVSFRGQIFEKPVRIRHATFEGNVDFSDITVDGELDLTGCTFTKTLLLAGAKVDGSLLLDDMVLTDTTAYNARAIDLVAPLDFYEAAIAGDLSLLRAEVSSTATPAQLGMRAIDVTGSVLLGGIQSGLSIHLDNARIAGGIDIGIDVKTSTAPMIDGALHARGIRVGGSVTLMGLSVDHDCNFEAADIDGSFAIHNVYDENANLHRAAFNQDVTISYAKIGKYLHLAGASIRGCLRLTGSTIGAMALEPFLFSSINPGETESIPCRIGSIEAPQMRIDSFAKIDMVQSSRYFHSLITWDFRGSRIAGQLSFWNASAFKLSSEPAVLSEFEHGSTVLGNIDLSNAVVGGRLVCTNLRVAGTLLMRDAQITGDIVFASDASLAADHTFTEYFGGARWPRLRGAVVQRLDIETLSCSGDIDLTGLRVVDPSSPRSSSPSASSGSLRRWLATYRKTLSGVFGPAPDTIALPKNGVVIARNMKIGGEMRLWNAPAEGRPEGYTWIDNSIDLSNTSATRLVLSAHSFDQSDSDENDVATSGINLSNATIHELLIPAVRSSSSGDRRASLFPVPIDLSDSRIGLWNLIDESLPERDRFRKLLKQDKRFRRSTYLAIEAYFRNRGHDADAAAIYRAMVNRAHLRSWSDLARSRWAPLLAIFKPLDSARHVVFWLALGFGTVSWRLFTTILVLWIVSLPVYGNRINFEPAPVARTVDKLSAEAVPTRWTLADALAVSFRYHVPLASLSPRAKWDLREDKPTCWGPVRENESGASPQSPDGASCQGTTISAVSPEDWGLLMAILNLIMWPLVLTVWIKKLLRQS